MLIQAEEMLIRTGGMLIRIGEMLIRTGGILIQTGGMLIRFLSEKKIFAPREEVRINITGDIFKNR